MAIQVQSLDHVTIVVKDMAATRRFYVELLGMAEVERPKFSFPGQWFRAGPTLIHTNLESAESGPAGVGAWTKPRGHHMAFLVDDARRVGDELQRAGIALVSPPKQRPDGAWQLFLQDPDGYLVELCSVG
jgi:catechol 2,3-dioxygenase-like lactoylglutathione lyase family enzyme